MEKITPETIINTMAKWVEDKMPIAPNTWVDGASKLNVLRGDLDDKYYTLEHNIAVVKADLLMDDKMTNAKAEAIIRSREDFMEMRKIGAKIKQIEEFIRLAKKRATLKDNEWSSQ